MKQNALLLFEIPNLTEPSSPKFRRVYEETVVVDKHRLRGCIFGRAFDSHPWGTGGMVVECGEGIRLWSVGTMKVTIDEHVLTALEPLVLKVGFTGQLTLDGVVFSVRVE